MIELGKQYKTRDGCEARVYAVDAGGQTPVHGAIKRNGVWVVTEWTKEGCWSTGYSINNLVEVKPRIQREVWVNVYAEGTSMWMSKEKANIEANISSYDRIACVKVVIDCEEGEGL